MKSIKMVQQIENKSILGLGRPFFIIFNKYRHTRYKTIVNMGNEYTMNWSFKCGIYVHVLEQQYLTWHGGANGRF